ncbi:MAG: lysylphosphatidylglycerol synthase transmembrane domain-containing protein [Prolixibacteraceae bacterium]|nr:lysylphosphatidylglycerol synthase transmembrane domain-containing protein [Prolixibacteraceae bacterium]
MKKKILNILKYIAFTALGGLLFWLVYRDQDFSKIWNTLTHEVDYRWIILSLFFGLLSHVSRTLRWKIALEPLGEHPKTINAFITVMVSYFMNLLLPRMGEFVRCGMLSRYEKIAFSKLFGTVITERIVDVLMLLISFSIVLVLEFDKIIHFGKENPQVVNNVKAILQSPYLWGGLVAAILGLLYYLHLSKKKGGKNKLEEVFNDFVQGVKSVLAMKRYKAYIAHTIFIWFMYFMMLWMVFFSLPFTNELNPLAALTTFVMASFGMVAPVQGGIGAWHFMAEKTLGLYGIESANGKIFALLAHTSMNSMIIVAGVICVILIPIVNRNYNPKEKEE